MVMIDSVSNFVFYTTNLPHFSDSCQTFCLFIITILLSIL